jgi:aminoglycoside phosphotransferase (APT) family kinase protein
VVHLAGLRIIETGWDSRVVDFRGKWIVRVARNEWAAKGYATEAKLLPRLAPALPVQVPLIVRAGKKWTLTRRIAGVPVDADASDAVGAQLASFLEALHAFPVADARRLGAPDEQRAVAVERFRAVVLPLLDRGERQLGESLLAEHERARFEPTLVHADLGPEHILVADGRVTGVLDWTDACIGDAAVDLAWALHGAPVPFAAAVAETYGVDEALARRALVYHALGPWHEVVQGVHKDKRWVVSGLVGVRARLGRVAEGAGTMDG